jgi:hypothetical protein
VKTQWKFKILIVRHKSPSSQTIKPLCRWVLMTHNNKKRFKNRMKSPQSQRRVKTILRLLYIPRPFQRYQLCEDWSVGTRCFEATKGRRQSEKYSYIVGFFTCHIWNMREVLVSCREKWKFFIADFHVLGLFMAKKHDLKIFSSVSRRCRWKNLSRH